MEILALSHNTCSFYSSDFSSYHLTHAFIFRQWKLMCYDNAVMMNKITESIRNRYQIPHQQSDS